MAPTTRSMTAAMAAAAAAANSGGGDGKKGRDDRRKPKMTAAQLKASKKKSSKVRKDKINNYKNLLKEIEDMEGLALVIVDALQHAGVEASDEAKKTVVAEILAYVGQTIEDAGI